MRVTDLKQLPAEYGCKVCGLTKPLAEMCLVHTKRDGAYRLRPRCKDCHNARERGHRREYKRAYLRRWRKDNANINRSYWQGRDDVREKARVNARRSFERNHDALLIQGRMRRRGYPVSLDEARELLRQYGPCYPTSFGLTERGKREAERIRSALRRQGKKRISNFEIRLMVYEDDKRNFIKPRLQTRPYQRASEQLKKWQAEQRAKRTAEVTA